jgi:surface protein
MACKQIFVQFATASGNLIDSYDLTDDQGYYIITNYTASTLLQGITVSVDTNVKNVQLTNYQVSATCSTCNDPGFTMLINTTLASPTSSFTIPTTGTGYGSVVSWGDGATSSLIGTPGNVGHTYSLPGTYSVNIKGPFPRIYFNNAGDRLKVLQVTSWGGTTWSSFNGAFYNCTNLTLNTATDFPNVSGVIDMTNAFVGTVIGTSSVTNSLSRWNTSNVQIFAGLFLLAKVFSPIYWNTSSGVTFSQTFQQVSAPSLSFLSYWNTSNARSLVQMLNSVSVPSTNIIDLSSWDVSNVTTFNQFNYNVNLKVTGIQKWNTSKATDMTSMFYLNSLITDDVSGWSVSNVSSISSVFRATNVTGDLSIWNVTNKVTSLQQAFVSPNLNFDASNWDVSNVTSLYQPFGANFNNGLAAGVYGTALNKWNVSKVTDFSIFCSGNNAFNQDISSWITTSGAIYASMFQSCNYNLPLFKITTASASNVSFNLMFGSNLVFNQNLDWNTVNATNYSQMFQNAYAFNNGGGTAISYWNVQKATTMNTMFNVAKVFNQDLSRWQPFLVTDFTSMFNGATAFNSPVFSQAGTSASSTNMTSMFQSAIVFNQNLSSLNTSKVTNMTSMFNGAIAYNNAGSTGIGAWDIHNVTTMATMFTGVTLSTTVYDAVLNGWYNKWYGGTFSVKGGVAFSGGNSKYSLGSSASRFGLINSFTWSITDGGWAGF